MTPKTRTIAVQVPEETHTLFRMLRASTGLTSAKLIALALERLTPEPDELQPDVLAEVRRHMLATAVHEHAPELVEVEPPVVAPIPMPTQDIDLDALYAELGINLNGLASNPFPE